MVKLNVLFDITKEFRKKCVNKSMANKLESSLQDSLKASSLGLEPPGRWLESDVAFLEYCHQGINVLRATVPDYRIKEASS